METTNRNVTNNGMDVVANALEYRRKADELKDEAIQQLLTQREQIDGDLRLLGYTNGATPKLPSRATTITETIKNRHRFEGVNVADAVKTLLRENTQLHGKEIERLCRDGGLQAGTQKFQNYLPVALKRAGGFENIGRNTWRLNEDIAPQKQR